MIARSDPTIMRHRDSDDARAERVALYYDIAAGGRQHGDRGTIAFVVSTDDLAEGKGDLYVALVVAAGLVDDGWGVMLWPTERYADDMPADVDIAVVMIDSYIPGLIDRRTRVIGWVRNWTDVWAGLPYLHEFDALWCSSSDSAATMARWFGGDIRIVPIATDPAIFAPSHVVERVPGVVTTANFWGTARGLVDALHLVADAVPVAWCGRNGEYLPSLGAIDHKGLVPWSELNEVYSGWALVLDDLIPAAAQYGNQNSRLFDALACGAFVITNESRGLAELGLDDVEVYTSPESLVPIVTELLSDPVALAERSERLRAVVLERHTGSRRAVELREHLVALLPHSEAPRGAREAFLRWASIEREHLRTQRSELDRARDELYRAAADQSLDFNEVKRKLDQEQERSMTLAEELARIRSSRAYRVARLMSQLVAKFRRLSLFAGRSRTQVGRGVEVSLSKLQNDD